MKESQMRDLYTAVLKVSNDSKLESVPAPAKPAYTLAAARMNQIVEFVRAVAKPVGQGTTVKICVASLADQRRMLEKLAPSLSFADAFAGNRFRTLRLGEKAVRTQAAAATEIISIPGSEALPDLEFFFGAETKPKADARAVVNGSWGPFRLISQEKHCFATDGGKTWLCPVEVIAGESHSYFVLSLQFEFPIPSVDQWP